MSSDSEYQDGFDAYNDGEKFDPKKPEPWKDGWRDAWDDANVHEDHW